MARLRNPATGSIVNVPDERAASYTAQGYEAVGDSPKKSGRKKANTSEDNSDQ